MTVLTVAATGAVHTGACVAVPRAFVEALASLRELVRDRPTPEREYCLHDEDGNALGVIRFAAGRPTVGRSAPSVFLRRPM